METGQDSIEWSEAWKLLNDIADTQTSPEYQCLEIVGVIQKTPELMAIIQKSPEIVAALEKTPELMEAVEKIPEILSVLEKTPEIAGVIQKSPKLVPTLIEFPAAAPILQKFPNLGPILGKASEIGMSFLRVASYTCGRLSNDMLEFQHAQTGLEFVLIPGGTFEMGSNDGESDEKPVHQVTLSPYFMSKTLVTQAVWHKIMNTDPSRFKGNDLPVESVYWQDYVEFCKKVGLSLPTEAQWEYACRAGSKTRWCFGDDEAQLEEYAWYNKNSDNQTHPVAQKKPNAYGLYDMHGNVWEWVLDWYSDYPSNSAADPVGPKDGSSHVHRGGSLYLDASGCRSARRDRWGAGYRSGALGFRVCVFGLNSIGTNPRK